MLPSTIKFWFKGFTEEAVKANTDDPSQKAPCIFLGKVERNFNIWIFSRKFFF